MILRTTHTPQTKEPIDLNMYVDADWAGCPSTRKATSRFIVTMMVSVVQFGSRTQAVVALSSAESELSAIGTGAQEGLHIPNFIKEATTTKVNIRIHTDSTSGKSIATRIGSSKKATHIDLKYLFIQQLVPMPTTSQLNNGRTNSFTTMAASMRVQYTHGGIKPCHTTLPTMCILCHRQYVLQDVSLTTRSNLSFRRFGEQFDEQCV